MITAAGNTMREFGRPRDIWLFGVAGYVGMYLPFLFHVASGFIFLRLPKAIWGTPVEENTVRLLFIIAGCLAVTVPAIVSGLYLREKTRFAFKRCVFYAGLALGALVTMIWLSPEGYAFILR